MLSLDSTSALTIGCGRCRFLVSSSLHCWNRMKLRSKGLDSRRKALRTSRSNWMKLRSGAFGCWNLRKKVAAGRNWLHCADFFPSLLLTVLRCSKAGKTLGRMGSLLLASWLLW
ncbi:hypothetical protein B296_00054599 [Ensete ventricosum]|uniref:Uncharacterized protein n=1 Tax=Ensete ventricosum TaxID=4639 RepID=A0A426XZF7_ENSVE|nr:hypothetical protein B296_00054599 [Ensete ventricosum]